jgi:hypothetical protein
MMKRTLVVATALLVACIGCGPLALAQTGSAKAPAPKGYESGKAGAKGADEPQEKAPDVGLEGAPARWEPVFMITSVEVLRSTRGSQLDIVRVRGLTSTDGWESPELVPLTRGTPGDGVLELLFVAQAPSAAMEPTGFASADAIFAVEPDHPYKGIRVHGATNGMTLKNLPGYVETRPIRDDCSKCVGKFFVAKGSAMPAGKSAADVVKETDLPPGLRVIKAADGIGKLETDPNRLTLLLDDEGRIEMAVWD